MLKRIVKGIVKCVVVLFAFIVLVSVAEEFVSIFKTIDKNKETTVQVTNEKSESSSEKKQKKSDRKKEEKSNKSQNGEVLYEDKNFKITYKGYEKMNFVTVIYPKIEIINKTDYDVTFALNDIYLNNQTVTVIYGVSNKIKAGKTNVQTYGFVYGNTDVEKDEEVEKIEFTFRAWDENFKTIAETKTLIIKPN